MSPAPDLAQSVGLLDIQRPDQRLRRRYPITLHVDYKLPNRGQVVRSGSGRTLNLSSGGVLFEANDSLPAGSRIELIINWPLLSKDVCPLKLVIRGRVVRSDAEGIAVKMMLHEFHGGRSAESGSV
jgi:hypothetical protein